MSARAPRDGDGSLALDWTSPARKRRVTAAMHRVERRLEEVAGRVPGTLGEAARGTLRAGGKRLRPVLVILCGRRDGPPPAAAVNAAAAVELLHMATLVHDDVLDRAELRRGKPTVVSVWGPETATSVGNYLFAGAFEQIVRMGDRRAVTVLSAVAADLSRGELLQMRQAHRADVTAEEYMTRCDLKTSGLFGVACALGALAARLPSSTVEALDGFGRRLGLAFQIFDDILDFSGEERRTGKRPGTDIRDGTVTLPLIRALERLPDLRPLVQGPTDDEDAVARIVDGVRASGGLEAARETALGLIEDARARLAGCGEEVDVSLLSQIAGRVVDRYS